MIKRILFVCLGNICRSPTAQGIFEHQLKTHRLSGLVESDSAGTADYHIGKAPDHRAVSAALGRGVDISHLRGRQVSDEDFHYYDLILVMDRSNFNDLCRRAPEACLSKVILLMDFAPKLGEEVPDPYYGGLDGFERVLDMLEGASAGLLEHLDAQEKLLASLQ